MATVLPIINSRWHYHFEKLKFSTKDFYQTVEKIIESREVPNLKMTRISLSQAGLFSGNREYLRVSRNDLAFDICAAPFGQDFFVSWWMGEKIGFFMSLIARIPIVGPWFVQRSQMKTYYQLDTEQMFRECVRKSVLEAVEGLNSTNGLRALSELERKYEDVKN